MPLDAPRQDVGMGPGRSTLLDGKRMSQPRAQAFAEWVKRTRAARKMSQQQLAEAWGITQPSISQAESGGGAGIGVLERIADAEKTTIDAIIGREVPSIPAELAGVDVAALVRVVASVREHAVTHPPGGDLNELSGSNKNDLGLAVGNDTTDAKGSHAAKGAGGKRGRVPRKP